MRADSKAGISPHCRLVGIFGGGVSSGRLRLTLGWRGSLSTFHSLGPLQEALSAQREVGLLLGSLQAPGVCALGTWDMSGPWHGAL